MSKQLLIEQMKSAINILENHVEPCGDRGYYRVKYDSEYTKSELLRKLTDIRVESVRFENKVI